MVYQRPTSTLVGFGAFTMRTSKMERCKVRYPPRQAWRRRVTSSVQAAVRSLATASAAYVEIQSVGYGRNWTSARPTTLAGQQTLVYPPS
jgi:hypothetical protein